MTKIDFRALRKDDHAEWLSLYRGYADHYNVQLTPDGVASTWSWLMDEGHPLVGIAAVLDGQLAGLAHFRAMPSPLRGQEVGFLDDIFVDPSCRGNGLADGLINVVKEHATANGWKVVRWITRDNNYRARSVYDRVADRSDWITYEMFCDG